MRFFNGLFVYKPVFVCSRGDTRLQTRKLGQSPMNVSATYMVKVARIY